MKVLSERRNFYDPFLSPFFHENPSHAQVYYESWRTSGDDKVVPSAGAGFAKSLALNGCAGASTDRQTCRVTGGETDACSSSGQSKDDNFPPALPNCVFKSTRPGSTGSNLLSSRTKPAQRPRSADVSSVIDTDIIKWIIDLYDKKESTKATTDDDRAEKKRLGTAIVKDSMSPQDDVTPPHVSQRTPLRPENDYDHRNCHRQQHDDEGHQHHHQCEQKYDDAVSKPSPSSCEIRRHVSTTGEPLKYNMSAKLVQGLDVDNSLRAKFGEIKRSDYSAAGDHVGCSSGGCKQLSPRRLPIETYSESMGHTLKPSRGGEGELAALDDQRTTRPPTDCLSPPMVHQSSSPLSRTAAEGGGGVGCCLASSEKQVVSNSDSAVPLMLHLSQQISTLLEYFKKSSSTSLSSVAADLRNSFDDLSISPSTPHPASLATPLRLPQSAATIETSNENNKSLTTAAHDDINVATTTPPMITPRRQLPSETPHVMTTSSDSHQMPEKLRWSMRTYDNWLSSSRVRPMPIPPSFAYRKLLAHNRLNLTNTTTCGAANRFICEQEAATGVQGSPTAFAPPLLDSARRAELTAIKQRQAEAFKQRLLDRPLRTFNAAVDRAIEREVMRSSQKVKFRVQHRTGFGQNVFICGSTKELGVWDAHRALPLRWTSGDIWQRDEIRLPRGITFEYKYIIKDDGFGPHRDYHCERRSDSSLVGSASSPLSYTDSKDTCTMKLNGSNKEQQKWSIHHSSLHVPQQHQYSSSNSIFWESGYNHQASTAPAIPHNVSTCDSIGGYTAKNSASHPPSTSSSEDIHQAKIGKAALSPRLLPFCRSPPILVLEDKWGRGNSRPSGNSGDNDQGEDSYCDHYNHPNNYNTNNKYDNYNTNNTYDNYNTNNKYDNYNTNNKYEFRETTHNRRMEFLYNL